jgi:predicted AAA+ superfamily ATPase
MHRQLFHDKISVHFKVHPICGVFGPRQVGKTTLAHAYIEHEGIKDAHFFDLENPIDLRRLDNPMLGLTSITSELIVIDEIQRKPDLFPILRVLADRPGTTQRFLILGSASRDLIRQSSETLAGRIGYIELPPFTLFETKESSRLWLRGGFPRSYLATTEALSFAWRQEYISTFVERDIPLLGFNVPPEQLRRFWAMLVHYQGQIFNASQIASSLGVSGHMVRKYLDILAGTFMVRILLPWYENIHKRQVKSPKIYIRDSGLVHTLLGIETHEQLQRYPMLGAFWEGFALEQVIYTLQATVHECYFWSTQSDAELDLLIMKHGKRIGFEFKYVDSPKITKSMRIALNDLSLDCVIVVYPGTQIFPMEERIYAYGLDSIATGAFMQQLKKDLNIT